MILLLIHRNKKCLPKKQQSFLFLTNLELFNLFLAWIDKITQKNYRWKYQNVSSHQFRIMIFKNAHMKSSLSREEHSEDDVKLQNIRL